MKQIALSLVVIAASGAYVWEQSGKAQTDDVLDSALPADAAERDAGQPAIPMAPAATFPVPAPALPEPHPQSTRLEHRLIVPAAVGEETTAAVPMPAPKPEQPAIRLSQVPPAPPSKPAVPVPAPTVAKPLPSIAVETQEISSFAVTPAVYIPIPQPRPTYPGAAARVVRAGMKAAVNTGTAKHHFADGTYVGPVTDAYYGPMQIQASIQGGRLTALKLLKYPSDRRTSVRINREALPMLRDEAISAQSADVDIISGATLTSRAFIQSLGGALRKASS